MQLSRGRIYELLNERGLDTNLIEDIYAKNQIQHAQENGLLDDTFAEALSGVDEYDVANSQPGQFIDHINKLTKDLSTEVSAVDQLKASTSGFDIKKFMPKTAGIIDFDDETSTDLDRSLPEVDSEEKPGIFSSILKGAITDASMLTAAGGLAADALGAEQLGDWMKRKANAGFEYAEGNYGLSAEQYEDQGWFEWAGRLVLEQVPSLVLTAGAGLAAKGAATMVAKPALRTSVGTAMRKEALEIAKSKNILDTKEQAKFINNLVRPEVVDEVTKFGVVEAMQLKGSKMALDAMTKRAQKFGFKGFKQSVGKETAKAGIKDVAEEVVSQKAVDVIAPALGAWAYNYATITGEVYRDLKEEAELRGLDAEPTLGDVWFGSALASSMDMIPGMYYMKKLGVIKDSDKLISAMWEAGEKQKYGFTQIMKDIGKTSFKEGSTEAIQGMISEATKGFFLDRIDELPIKDLETLLDFVWRPEARDRYWMEFGAGATVGGVFGGGGAFMQAKTTRKQNQSIEALEAADKQIAESVEARKRARIKEQTPKEWKLGELHELESQPEEDVDVLVETGLETGDETDIGETRRAAGGFLRDSGELIRDEDRKKKNEQGKKNAEKEGFPFEETPTNEKVIEDFITEYESYVTNPEVDEPLAFTEWYRGQQKLDEDLEQPSRVLGGTEGTAKVTGFDDISFDEFTDENREELDKLVREGTKSGRRFNRLKKARKFEQRRQLEKEGKDLEEISKKLGVDVLSLDEQDTVKEVKQQRTLDEAERKDRAINQPFLVDPADQTNAMSDLAGLNVEQIAGTQFNEMINDYRRDVMEVKGKLPEALTLKEKRTAVAHARKELDRRAVEYSQQNIQREDNKERSKTQIQIAQEIMLFGSVEQLLKNPAAVNRYLTQVAGSKAVAAGKLSQNDVSNVMLGAEAFLKKVEDDTGAKLLQGKSNRRRTLDLGSLQPKTQKELNARIPPNIQKEVDAMSDEEAIAMAILFHENDPGYDERTDNVGDPAQEFEDDPYEKLVRRQDLALKSDIYLRAVGIKLGYSDLSEASILSNIKMRSDRFALESAKNTIDSVEVGSGIVRAEGEKSREITSKDLEVSSVFDELNRGLVRFITGKAGSQTKASSLKKSLPDSRGEARAIHRGATPSERLTIFTALKQFAGQTDNAISRKRLQETINSINNAAKERARRKGQDSDDVLFEAVLEHLDSKDIPRNFTAAEMDAALREIQPELDEARLTEAGRKMLKKNEQRLLDENAAKGTPLPGKEEDGAEKLDGLTDQEFIAKEAKRYEEFTDQWDEDDYEVLQAAEESLADGTEADEDVESVKDSVNEIRESSEALKKKYPERHNEAQGAARQMLANTKTVYKDDDGNVVEPNSEGELTAEQEEEIATLADVIEAELKKENPDEVALVRRAKSIGMATQQVREENNIRLKGETEDLTDTIIMDLVTIQEMFVIAEENAAKQAAKVEAEKTAAQKVVEKIMTKPELPDPGTDPNQTTRLEATGVKQVTVNGEPDNKGGADIIEAGPREADRNPQGAKSYRVTVKNPAIIGNPRVALTPSVLSRAIIATSSNQLSTRDLTSFVTNASRAGNKVGYGSIKAELERSGYDSIAYRDEKGQINYIFFDSKGLEFTSDGRAEPVVEQTAEPVTEQGTEQDTEPVTEQAAVPETDPKERVTDIIEISKAFRGSNMMRLGKLLKDFVRKYEPKTDEIMRLLQQGGEPLRQWFKDKFKIHDTKPSQTITTTDPVTNETKPKPRPAVSTMPRSEQEIAQQILDNATGFLSDPDTALAAEAKALSDLMNEKGWALVGEPGNMRVIDSTGQVIVAEDPTADMDDLFSLPEESELGEGVENLESWLDRRRPKFIPESMIELVTEEEYYSRPENSKKPRVTFNGIYNRNDGKIYINKDVVKADDLPRILFHEALGHAFLRKTIGDVQYKALMDQIIRDIRSRMVGGKDFIVNGESMKARFDRYSKLYAEAEDVNHRIGEELFNMYIEANVEGAISNRGFLSRMVVEFKDAWGKFVHGALYGEYLESMNDTEKKARELVEYAKLNNLNGLRKLYSQRQEPLMFSFELTRQREEDIVVPREEMTEVLDDARKVAQPEVVVSAPHIEYTPSEAPEAPEPTVLERVEQTLAEQEETQTIAKMERVEKEFRRIYGVDPRRMDSQTQVDAINDYSDLREYLTSLSDKDAVKAAASKGWSQKKTGPRAAREAIGYLLNRHKNKMRWLTGLTSVNTKSLDMFDVAPEPYVREIEGLLPPLPATLRGVDLRLHETKRGGVLADLDQFQEDDLSTWLDQIRVAFDKEYPKLKGGHFHNVYIMDEKYVIKLPNNIGHLMSLSYARENLTQYYDALTRVITKTEAENYIPRAQYVSQNVPVTLVERVTMLEDLPESEYRKIVPKIDSFYDRFRLLGLDDAKAANLGLVVRNGQTRVVQADPYNFPQHRGIYSSVNGKVRNLDLMRTGFKRMLGKDKAGVPFPVKPDFNVVDVDPNAVDTTVEFGNGDMFFAPASEPASLMGLGADNATQSELNRYWGIRLDNLDKWVRDQVKDTPIGNWFSASRDNISAFRRWFSQKQWLALKNPALKLLDKVTAKAGDIESEVLGQLMSMSSNFFSLKGDDKKAVTKTLVTGDIRGQVYETAADAKLTEDQFKVYQEVRTMYDKVKETMISDMDEAINMLKSKLGDVPSLDPEVQKLIDDYESAKSNLMNIKGYIVRHRPNADYHVQWTDPRTGRRFRKPVAEVLNAAGENTGSEVSGLRAETEAKKLVEIMELQGMQDVKLEQAPAMYDAMTSADLQNVENVLNSIFTKIDPTLPKPVIKALSDVATVQSEESAIKLVKSVLPKLPPKSRQGLIRAISEGTLSDIQAAANQAMGVAIPSEVKQLLKSSMYIRDFQRHYKLHRKRSGATGGENTATDLSEAELAEAGVVGGYETIELTPGMLDYIGSFARHHARRRIGLEMKEAFEMKDSEGNLILDPSNNQTKGLYTAATDMARGGLEGFSEADRLRKKVTTAAYHFHIGGRVSSAAYNLTQLHIFGSGLMRTLEKSDKVEAIKAGVEPSDETVFGNLIENTKRLVSGHNDASVFMWAARSKRAGGAVTMEDIQATTWPNSITEADLEVLNRYHATAQAQTLSAITHEQAIANDGKILKQGWHQYKHVMGKMMQLTESSNRLGAFLAHHRVKNDFDLAADFTRKLNGDYTKQGQVGLFRDNKVLGAMFDVFGTHPQNIMHIMGLMAGVDPVSLAYTSATMSLMVGAPGGATAAALWRMWRGDDMHRYVEHHYGKEVADFIRAGYIAPYFGIDASNNMALSIPPAFTAPLAALTGNGQQHAVVKPLIDSWEAIKEGDLLKAIPLRAWQSAYGAYDSDELKFGKRKALDEFGRPIKLNMYERVLSGLGFTPLRKGIMQEQYYDDRLLNRDVNEGRGRVTNLIQSARTPADRREAMREMKDFNEFIRGIQTLPYMKNVLKTKALTWDSAKESTRGTAQLT